MVKKIVIFGYGWAGSQIYRKLEEDNNYCMLGFADNSPLKQGNYAFGHTIKSLRELVALKDKENFSVIIASNAWIEIGASLEKLNILVEGIYKNGEIVPYNPMNFAKLDFKKSVHFYAGNICDEVHLKQNNLYGLSINQADDRHIFHDITQKYPLNDNCIDSYQAEDVLEHIELDKVIPVINEIYRILKPGSLFRICLPDYFSPHLKHVSMKDSKGKIIYDATGGGSLGKLGVENGGHVWFPTYSNVKKILEETHFKKIDFLCYYTEQEDLVRKDIDFSKGYIRRIPEKIDRNNLIYSMVIDCYK